MAYSSDIDGLSAWLDGVIDEIGWDIAAADGAGTLADATIDVVIDGIQARARVQRGPDGDPDEEWRDNEDEYRKRKERLYGPRSPNYRTDQMLSRESLKGTPTVGKLETSWPYGTGATPTDARSERDARATDADKARYAHEGQSKKRVKRPFFAVTEQDADDAMPAIEDAIIAHIERSGNQP